MIRKRARAIGLRNLPTPAGTRVDAAADGPPGKKREPESSPGRRTGCPASRPARPCARPATRTDAGRACHQRGPSHRDTTDSGDCTRVRPPASRHPAAGRRGTLQRTVDALTPEQGERGDRTETSTPRRSAGAQGRRIPRRWRDPAPCPLPQRTIRSRERGRAARDAPRVRRAALRTPAVPGSELPGGSLGTGRRRVRRERSVSSKSESTPSAPLPIIGSARTAHRKTQTSRRSRRSPRDGDRRVIADDRARIGTGRGVTTRDTPRRRP